MPNLSGKVCLVTGASRGIGRGAAIQLTAYGATCYATGRDLSKLELVKKEAESRGTVGKLVPVECDHSDDKCVEELFKKISTEQNGQLDLLVNNAFGGVKFILENSQQKFWDYDAKGWDLLNNVGLRSHYICAMHAARLMVPRRKGLIVNISSLGGKRYVFMPTYGIGKVGGDRMAQDCAVDLEEYNIAFVSLWPGMVKTESIEETQKDDNHLDNTLAQLMRWMFDYCESTEYAGKCIAHLLGDDDVIKRSGRILLTTDLADEFHFNDVTGASPMSTRSLKFLLATVGWLRLAKVLPEWLQVPKCLYMLLLSNSSVRLSLKQKSRFA